MKLSIKVVPGASRNCIVGWLGESLKVCVNVPAEKGKAIKVVEKVIAETLGISTSNVSIIKGHTASRKIIEISGLPDSEIHKVLKII